MRDLLDKLFDGEDLDRREAESLLAAFIDPQVSDAEKGAALGALRAKGETGEELAGLAMAMRRAAVQVDVPEGAPIVDTCGTGGDGSNSFNVSTTTALLLAASGLRVVKHGNRSVSSKSGSADVLEALGVSLAEDADTARGQLVDTSFTFLFAPAFHPATAAVVPVRRAIRARTAFNLLGPLTNPAWPKHQLVGAFSPEAAETMADALSRMPIERCFVVHGAPSCDEATPCGPFLRYEVTPGEVERVEVDPLFTYGIPRCELSDLQGGDAIHNARILEDIFSGTYGPMRNAVLLNAALVFELVEPGLDPKEAVARGAEIIDSGRATWFLSRLRSTQR
jgi:anthranilate phosphoribosyltransferase